MNLENLDKSGVLLVDPRPESWPYPLFVTVSPNPHTKHSIYKTTSGKRVTVKMPYGKLPQRVQYDYCIRVLKSAYNISNDVKIFGVWELNQQGNVHFHFILSDPTIKGRTTLAMLQRDVLNCEIVMKNLSKGMVDYMNNIVTVNDSIEARIKYMCKDINDNIEIMPYFCTSNSIKSP